MQDGSVQGVNDWWKNSLNTGVFSYLGVTLSKGKDNTLVISLMNEATISVRAIENQLQFQTSLPDKLKKNNLKGLIGTFDGNPSNDFTQPDGTVLTGNLTERELFAYGKKWAILSSESIMYYDRSNNEDYSLFNKDKDSFVPVFFDEVYKTLSDKDKNDLKSTCDDNYQCQLDFYVTRNVAFAKNTKNFDNNLMKDEKDQINSVPVFENDDDSVEWKVEVNNSYYLKINATDKDNDTITFHSNKLPSGAILNSSTGEIYWSVISDEFDGELKIIAQDSKGANSTELIINIQLCNCSGQGDCDWDRALPGYNNSGSFFQTYCKCYREYEGDHCELDYDGCRDDPCFEGQTCTDVSASLHKTLKVGFNCSDCPTGYKILLKTTTNEKEGKCIGKQKFFRLFLQNFFSHIFYL